MKTDWPAPLQRRWTGRLDRTPSLKDRRPSGGPTNAPAPTVIHRPEERRSEPMAGGGRRKGGQGLRSGLRRPSHGSPRSPLLMSSAKGTERFLFQRGAVPERATCECRLLGGMNERITHAVMRRCPARSRRSCERVKARPRAAWRCGRRITDHAHSQDQPQ